jgi:diguanylate cyclase (GGDEF)-like protein/PAS domain S-box-containing protein
MYSPSSSCKHILDNLFDGVYCLDTNKRVTFWNRSAEIITGYTRDEAIANMHCTNMLAHTDQNGENLCENQCPVSLTLSDGLTRELNVFFRHKKGYRVPVSIRIFPLWAEDGSISGVVEAFVDNSPHETLFRELEQLKDKANIDQLTGLFTRRYGEIILNAKLAEHQLGGRSMAVLFADIDKFKTVNDVYGHQIGDVVLKTISKTLASAIREGDYVIRWGGEELLIVLTGTFNTAVLARVANKLRMLVQQTRISATGYVIEVTISIGATLTTSVDTLETLVSRADTLMYQSKRTGRNRVTVG